MTNKKHDIFEAIESLYDNSEHLQDDYLEFIQNTSVDRDYDFIKLSDGIKAIFKKYSPKDIVTNLNCLELWLPNISSGFKFAILYNVFLSMTVDGFSIENKITTYEKFKEFSNSLIDLMPNFPMIEDFIPEIDWGEIKLSIEEDKYNILYGGSVERIVDFVQAFLIMHQNNSKAISDIELVAELQHYIINELKGVVKKPKSISTGNFEIPSEDFWLNCKSVIETISENHLFENKNTITLGTEKNYESIQDIGNAFLGAQLNQALSIEINQSYYPFSIRNHFSIIIDKWSTVGVSNFEGSQNLCHFMNRRFECLNDTPVVLFDDRKKYSTIISSIFYIEKKLHFIVFCDNSKSTSKFETELNQVLARKNFGINKIGTHLCMEFNECFGQRITRDDIEIIYILNHISTTNGVMELPERGHITSLPDAITVLDSIEKLSDFKAFLDFYGKSIERIRIPTGWVDSFATFMNQHGMIEEGAIEFDTFFFDPHGGSNWRFNYLSKYWDLVVANFPNNQSKWIPVKSYDGIQQVSATNKPVMNWSTDIEKTSFHFEINYDELLDLKPINIRMLDFFCESSADALSQRKDIIKELELITKYKKIIFKCSLDNKSIITDDFNLPTVDIPISDDLPWDIIKNDIDKELVIQLKVNILALKYECEISKNSEFQGKLSKTLLNIIYQINNREIDLLTLDKIKDSYNYEQRVALGSTMRQFDSKDSFYHLPEAIHYKTARKELAKVIKNHGYETKRYELEQAKELMNDVSSSYLEVIQNFILQFDKVDLIKKNLANYDAYIQKNHTDKYRAIESLNHVVNFNREEQIYKLQKEFITQGNNHRYIIERLIANKQSGNKNISEDDLLLLIAHVDWLHTLYSASDTLHNGLDIGGIDINNQFVPEVFYSNDSDFDAEFGKEVASYHLGTTINESDEVNATITEDLLQKLDIAFLDDVKFSFTRLIQVLDILMGWASINKISMLNYYQVSSSEIVQICISQILEVNQNNINNIKLEIKNIIDFLTLDSDRVLKKLGQDKNEFDIPISEHRKRDQRLNLKPLIRINDDNLLWSAGCVYRTHGIWLTRIEEGWLPADFQWKKVSSVIDTLKKQIEKDLETATFSVFQRLFNPKYCQQGLDFRKSFKKEGFDDVGDYDSLVYIPESNTWIMIECKYNQMPFCLKDMKRLQEKIFGNHKKSHIPKIMKRYNFLKQNHEKIRQLLNYPISATADISIINVYVAKQINWIHRKPPYETNIHFVQLNNLEFWLNNTLPNLQVSLKKATP